MKKVLFYSVLAVLAAGCAENELDSLSVATQGEGISFEAEEAPATRMQWDETETSYVPFWYAEQDRIGIFAVNVKRGAFGNEADLTTGRMEDNWSGLPTTASAADATYKATQSQRTGAFTSENDNSLLHFNGNKEARFLGVYPKSVKAAYASGKVILSNLPVLTTQKQTTTKGYNEATLMYSMSVASKVNSYDAVGEKVNLQFKRPLAALVLSTKNADDYTTGDNSVFGNLKTITVEAKGWTPESGKDGKVDPSLLAYDPNEATLEVDTLDYSAELVRGSDLATGGDKVVLTIGDGTSGLAWSDADLAIASIMRVDRSENFSADKPETMKVTFSFANIDLPLVKSTSKSWNGFVEYPALNIEDFPYLVTKGLNNTRALIVNSGNFSDIYTKDGKAIDWSDTQTTAGATSSTSVGLGEIETIISKVALTNAELAKLQDFTALKNLTLAENTSIPANTFSTGQASQMVKLDLPKVTSVDKKFIANNEADGTTYAFSGITDLLMPKYEFEDEVVNKAFFNSEEQGKLVNIDMSGVRSMMPKFGILRTLAFTNYSALKTVKVQDNMVVSPSGFAKCPLLEKIDGIVDISEAPSAFMNPGGSGANDKNNELTSIELTNGIIPDDAFRCCTALKEVKCAGAAIVPTSIGARAFVWTKVEYMDLSKVTTLGEEAFRNSSIYSANKDTQILTVGATELPAKAFQNCTKLQIVKFTNATKITGDNVFDGANAMRQIKFLKTISLANGAYTESLFGTSENIDLWTNPSQSGVNGLTWTLSAKKDSSANADVESYNFTFKSIQKKIED